MRLPRTARDVLELRPGEWLLYNGLIALCRMTGRWRYPIDASGDLETMTTLDKIYWVYKTTYPMTRPRKGSGLEAHFERGRQVQWQLPVDFCAGAEASLSAVGDLMDHPYLPHSAKTLYAETAELIFGADLAMANLECVLWPDASGQLLFSPRSGPPLYYMPAHFDVVKGHNGRTYGFVATASNHSLDFGAEGVESTMRSLEREGIAFNGLNRTRDGADAVTVVERNGIRLGLAAHTFGLNAHQPPPDRPWLVNRTRLNGRLADIDLGQLERQLAGCKQDAVDFSILQLHWGLEHEHYPTPDQVELAHHLAELGFDLVIGHHPHVAQPLELYRTARDPNRIVPIYYSLGNLVNPFSARHVSRSLVARLALVRGTCGDGATRTYVKHAAAIEVEQHADVHARELRLLRA